MDEDLLRSHHALVPGELPWRARFRLMQSLWRQDQGLTPMPWKPEEGLPFLGSRLEVEEATRDGSNFLTPVIFERVRSELDANGSRSSADRKLITEPRIFNDLLSSQPLAFNLFTELDADRDLASQVFRVLWPQRVRDVTRIDFEWSPGRGDSRYLGNRSAFDVYVEHTTLAGAEGFIGIEVKYHEDLRAKPGELRSEAHNVIAWSGLISDADEERWVRGPLNQILLDHLLALSMLRAEDQARDGLFVFLYPTANTACRTAATDYAVATAHNGTFQAVTLEEFVSALRAVTPAPWALEFHHRYLALDRLHTLG